MHLSLLFKGMARHKIVPDPFGVGVIIPLLKDKEGDCNSIDNYRGITLCPVISKLFELVVIDSYSHMLTTDDLQFGFKPNLSCDSGLLVLFLPGGPLSIILLSTAARSLLLHLMSVKLLILLAIQNSLIFLLKRHTTLAFMFAE